MDDLMKATIDSIKAFYDDNAFGETNKIKEVKYNKKYFDDFENETFGEKEAKAEPKESKIAPEKQALLGEVMKAGAKGEESEEQPTEE